MNNKSYNLGVIPSVFFDLIARIFPIILLISFLLLDDKKDVVISQSIFKSFLSIFLIIIVYFLGISVDTFASFIDDYLLDRFLGLYNLIDSILSFIKDKICVGFQENETLSSRNRMSFLEVWKSSYSSQEDEPELRSILIKLIAEASFFRNVTFLWLILVFFRISGIYKSLRVKEIYISKLDVFCNCDNCNIIKYSLFVFVAGFLFFLYYLRRRIVISFVQEYFSDS